MFCSNVTHQLSADKKISFIFFYFWSDNLYLFSKDYAVPLDTEYISVFHWTRVRAGNMYTQSFEILIILYNNFLYATACFDAILVVT